MNASQEHLLQQIFFSTQQQFDAITPDFFHTTALILVDHGSRREASNLILNQLVLLFQEYTPWQIIEIAHMELASPSIAEAFSLCVTRGATRVVIFPYFLSPGRHWDQDIPQLAAEAALSFPNTPYLVTAPLGIHPFTVALIQQRILSCLSPHLEECSFCGKQRCFFKSS
jgi:sirohydrochlorin ferrochelatase